MLEGGRPARTPPISSWSLEAERIVGRLAFLATLAQLWKLAAVASVGRTPAGRGDRDSALAGWLARAVENRRQLLKLLAAVHRYRIPLPRGNHDSLVEYDRRQGIKELLLEQIIAACVETADAARGSSGPSGGGESARVGRVGEPAEQVFESARRGDVAAVRRAWPHLLAALRRQPLLYMRPGPRRQSTAGRGLAGPPAACCAGCWPPCPGWACCRDLQADRRHPRNGARPPGRPRRHHRVRPSLRHRLQRDCRVHGRRFGELGKAVGQEAPRPSSDAGADRVPRRGHRGPLARWLGHSRNIRLSVLETVQDKNRWQLLQQFIERYGHDLFTQRFMNYGNLRAILHEGVEPFLAIAARRGPTGRAATASGRAGRAALPRRRPPAG